MTERPSRAVDLHGFALREFLEFVRKEDPSWIEGAHVRRSDDGHQRSGVVEGMVWVQVLMSDKAAEAPVQRQACQHLRAYFRGGPPRRG